MAIKIEAVKRIQEAQRIQAATSVEDLIEDSDYEGTLAFIKDPKNASSIKAAVLKGYLCPSGWSTFNKPYPGELAKILVASKAEESLADLTNSYYASDRKLSPEAKEIFENKVLSNVQNAISPYSDGWIGSQPFNGFSRWAKANKDFVKKMVMKIPKDAWEQLLKSDAESDWRLAAKLVGLKIE